MTRRDATWLIAAAGAATLLAAPPKFFSTAEFQKLETFTTILIPTDDTPGAKEAQVAPFIDFVVNASAEYAPEEQERWRRAMDWLRNRDVTEKLIDDMSAPEHEGFATYQLIKEMTVRAFYTSQVGLRDVLEYKGIAYLHEFPGCSHPEHQHV